jgi:hypothetical protein
MGIPLSGFISTVPSDKFRGGCGGCGNTFFCHWAGTFAVTELVKFNVLKFIEPSVVQSVSCAIERTTIDDNDALRFFGRSQQRLHTPANSGETRHLAQSLSC